MRLLMLFLSLPWWLHMALAGGLAYWTWTGAGERSADAAVIEAAIERPAPDVTAMMSGKRPQTGEVPEVVLRAQVNTDLTTQLIQRKNGIVTSRHLMYVLVATDTDQMPNAVDGLIILPMSQQDALVEFLVQNTVDWGAVGPIVELPGAIKSYDGKVSHARSALADHNLELAADEFYFTPFLDGREAGLRALAAKETKTTFVYFLVAFGVFVIGVARLFMDRLGKREDRNRPRMTPEATQAVLTRTETAAEPAIYGVLTPEEEAALTPLQRIKRRQALGDAGAAGAASTTAIAVDPVASARVEPTQSVSKSRFQTLSPAATSGVTRKDRFGSGPIKSTRRRGRKADPFDRLADDAARF